MTEHPGEAAPAERDLPAAPRPATGPGGARSGAQGGEQSGGQVRPEGDAGLEELPPNLTQAILEATKQVASLLKGAGHPFALAGSVAVYAHGGPGNLQHDADFCVLPEDADAVAATLRDAGLEVYTPPEDWLLKARCMGQDIDLIFELARQPVTRELLGRAEELPVESVRMPVLSVTDLLASLLNAFTEHHCDFGAVLPIARALREKVDWSRVRRECGAAPMPDAFLYLLERLQVISPQDDDRGGLP
ncbi:nucleotidyltransferase family protein [Streptomyces fenghuangensis]|uniref:Nucleotidyltransferase family protein n=1 Tax=Streptomyces chitinivorans TaxID=1257027 RepID=A0ABW7HSS0_9ACTN|nr:MULTISPECIES: nucleotidyltransferase family protein [Streptomyces]MCG3040830.1 nucleotidyltransferase family protein [Streptomyces sp. ICN903]MDH2412090.1 nucleotidyltransferase family protein [Streptomyces chitinivorans]